MKRVLSFLFAGMMVLTVGACGNGSENSKGETNASAAGIVETSAGNEVASITKYTVDVEELDAFARPDDYPWIPAEEFKKSFQKMSDLSLSGELETYEEVVEIFGVEGAYFKNCDYDDGLKVYKYFNWYADDDTSVLMTFKVDGDDLKYAAYTGNGVNIH